jgi:hypothetical protein
MPLLLVNPHLYVLVIENVLHEAFISAKLLYAWDFEPSKDSDRCQEGELREGFKKGDLVLIMINIPPGFTQTNYTQ